MKKRFAQALIASVVMSSLMITPVFATPSVEDLEGQKAAAEGEVGSLQEQLNALATKMNDLETKLIKTGEDLIKTKEDLKVAEEKEAKQYEDMKLRIQYMYEEGDASAFEKLATSGSISEVLSQMEYVAQVHSYDRDMLTEYENTVKEVEDIKVTLEDEQKKLETLQEDFEGEKAELTATIEAKRDEVENLDGMLQAAAQAALDAQREEEAQEQQTNTGGGNPGGGSNSGGNAPTYNPVTGNAVVDRAIGCLGIPYATGGVGPGSFDCSGLVGYALTGSFSRLGTTWTYMGWPQVSDPQPGDVCTSSYHCGIYVGGGQMIHAPEPGDVVKYGAVQSDMIYVRPPW